MDYLEELLQHLWDRKKLGRNLTHARGECLESSLLLRAVSWHVVTLGLFRGQITEVGPQSRSTAPSFGVGSAEEVGVLLRVLDIPQGLGYACKSEITSTRVTRIMQRRLETSPGKSVQARNKDLGIGGGGVCPWRGHGGRGRPLGLLGLLTRRSKSMH